MNSSIFIFTGFLILAASSGQRKPSKPSKPSRPSKVSKVDSLLVSPPEKACLWCLLMNARQCIPSCIPNMEHTPECIYCIISQAAMCLKQCGLPKTDAEFGPYLYGNGTCKAVPKPHIPHCELAENKCDYGFHPLPIFIRPPGCDCFCEKDMG